MQTDSANTDLELKPYNDLLSDSLNTEVVTAHIINRNLDDISRCSYNIPRCTGAVLTHALKAFGALTYLFSPNSATPLDATPVWLLHIYIYICIYTHVYTYNACMCIYIYIYT